MAVAPDGLNSPEDTEEPDRLELLDAAISARPARRCSLSPGAVAAAAALARPLAASAAPSPWQSPGDTQKAPASGLCLHFLLHQMTRCCRRYLFVVSVPLGALHAFLWCRGRWERRETEGRPERANLLPAEPQLRSALPGARLGPRRPGGPQPPLQLPAPSAGLPPPRRHFEPPGQGRRETDRQSDLPLLPPPQLGSRAHKGRSRDAGAQGLVQLPRARQLLRRGLEPESEDCRAGWGRCTGERDPEVRGRGGGRGARGGSGCRALRCSEGLKAAGEGSGRKVVGLVAPGQDKEQRDSRGGGSRGRRRGHQGHAVR